MTVYSIPLVPCLANIPGTNFSKSERDILISKAWFKILENGECKIPNDVLIGTFPDMKINFFEQPRGNIFEKFKNKSQYPHFAIYQELIHCEIVIDDRNWNTVMPEYSSHDLRQKERTIRLATETFVWLLKLRGFQYFHTPIMLRGTSIKDIWDTKNNSIEILPLYHKPMSAPLSVSVAEFGRDYLFPEDIDWVLKNHLNLYNLFYEAKNFQAVANALKHLTTDVETEVAMITIWAAIEHIVKPTTNIRQTISKRCAMILYDRNIHPDMNLSDIYREIIAFYDFRCDIVHGNKPLIKNYDTPSNKDLKRLDGFQGSFNLFRLLIMEIIERGRFYEREELDLFEEKFDELQRISENQ